MSGKLPKMKIELRFHTKLHMVIIKVDVVVTGAVTT